MQRWPEPHAPLAEGAELQTRDLLLRRWRKHDREPFAVPPERYVPNRIRTIGATPLAIEHVHALAVASLPRHHRDPFDRLLSPKPGCWS